MNRKKTIRNLNPGSVIFLVLVAIALASAGVFHAYVKNLQVEVGRKIEKTEQRISQHQLDIKTLQMHLDQQLNRFLIRDQLRQSGSELVSIPVNVLEEISSDGAQQLPGLARRDP
jgi:cell division protein FtsL